MRVAVYGCKHDAGMFEELLKEYCLLDPAVSLGNTMIDTACLNAPKVTSSSGATLVVCMTSVLQRVPKQHCH